jgi:hypothetical protein
MTTRQRQNLWIALAAFALVLVATLEIGAEVRAGRPGDHPRQLHGDAGRFSVIPVTDDGVQAPTAAQRANAEAGLAAMQRWLGAHGGAVVTRPTDVLLTDHDHCPSSRGQHPEAAGITIDGKKICLFTADTPTLQVPTFLRQTAAHEAVHVLQGQLGCAAPLPGWLIEGMAEDLSWRTILADDETTLKRWAGMEQGQKFSGGLNYGTAMGAVLDLDGGRPARLVDFCRAVGEGAPWRLAFSQAFGASADQYAARF